MFSPKKIALISLISILILLFAEKAWSLQSPVYRFWSDTYFGHFFTISEAEKTYIIATYPPHIWRYEGIAWYAFTTPVSGTSPVYRFWSDTYKHHFFTISEEEKNYIIATYPPHIWRYEGIAWYAFPSVINSEELAFQHLEEVMDNFHETFDVYTDLSAAGNHFVTLGRMSSTGDEDKVQINPGHTVNCFSGATCIENRFYSSGNNWGGWYFMNGVLEGEETQPKLNWGDYPNAGINLTGATKITFWAKGSKGGERVEFFAFGVGRDSITGNPIKLYPDSSPKVSLGYITLSDIWTQYTIDLIGKDLSYVIGGFGWVTNAPQNNNQNITFYLDDIKYNKSRLTDPRFLVSYETTPSSLDFDTIMKNVAFTYDNALVLIAFLSRGTAGDMQRAKLLADALVYAINNDRYFTDGRLRNAYQGGDLVLFPGWTPNGKAKTVRMPGWWNSSKNAWYEDRFQVSTHTGNLAWVMIALLSYYEKSGGSQYLDAAKKIGEWIEMHTKDTRGAGGYTGGYDGWEMTSNNPGGQTKILWKSTEHNIDVYVAFASVM